MFHRFVNSNSGLDPAETKLHELRIGLLVTKNGSERKQVNCWLWRLFGPILIRFACQRRMTDATLGLQLEQCRNMKVLQLHVFIFIRRESDKRDKSSLIIMQNEDLLK